MTKTVAAVQSNYIPWKGYFELIGLVDEFVFYDDVQYSKGSWRNRNRIMTSAGPIWLTIPVVTKGKLHQKVRDVKVADRRWARHHWRSIEVHYAKARYFREYRAFFEDLYLGAETQRLSYLSEVNRRFVTAICELIGIHTELTWVMDLELSEADRVGRLVEMCTATSATRYVTGPSALDYIAAEPFEQKGITLEIMDYAGYPAYEQLHAPFVHEVSVLDLILNTGPAAPLHMRARGLKPFSADQTVTRG